MSAEEEVTVTCWVEEEGVAINVVVQVLVQVLLMMGVDMAVMVIRVLDVTVVVIVGSKQVATDEHTSLIVVVAISNGCDSE